MRKGNGWRTIAGGIDRLNEAVGKAMGWLLLVMVVVVVYDVAMRFFFRQGSVALQELEWHLFALVFLLAAAYTLKHDDHVRVDIFYRGKTLTNRHRALIDLLGTLGMLLPFCLLVIYTSYPFVANAYVFAEGSPDPGGLPYRFLLKATIPLGFALLLLQGLVMVVRAIAVLRGDAIDNEGR